MKAPEQKSQGKTHEEAKLPSKEKNAEKSKEVKRKGPVGTRAAAGSIAEIVRMGGISASEGQSGKGFWATALLPDQSVLSKVFWTIIQSQPVDYLGYASCIAIEELAQAAIAGMLIYSRGGDIGFSNGETSTLNDVVNGGVEATSKEINTEIKQTSDAQEKSLNSIALIATSSLVCLYSLALLAMAYLYRCLKSHEDVDSITTVQIVSKLLSAMYTLQGTVLNLGVIFLTIWSFFLVAYNQDYTDATRPAQLVLTVILLMVSQLFQFMHDCFYNLNFMNTVLVSAHSSSLPFSIMKPLYYCLTCVLSLKPNQDRFESFVYLLVLAALGVVQVLLASVQRAYYNSKLEWASYLMKIAKASAICSFAFACVFEKFTIKESALIFAIVAPFILGSAYLLRLRKESKLYHKLSHYGVEAFSDQNDLESMLCQVQDYLLNKESTMTHNKFQGLLLVNERTVTEDSQSFLKTITKLVALNDQINGSYYTEDNDGDHHEIHAGSDIEESRRGFERFGSFGHDIYGTVDGITNVDTPGLPPSALKQTSAAKDLEHQGGGRRMNSLHFAESIGDKGPALQLNNNHLDDVYISETGGSNGGGARKNQMANINVNKNIVKINGLELDISDIPSAIQKVKLKFLYEVLIKQACAQFPEHMFFMFYKSYIALDYFHNKYLALTTVTHLNNLRKKQSFKESLQNQISINYFLKSILSAANSTIANSSSQDTELDSTVLLDQSLKIDEIINCIQVCSLKITLFWQMTANEQATNDQITQLQSLSMEISQMLKDIRGYVKQMELLDGQISQCQTLYYYLSYFFIVVIRDKNVGFSILRQMNQMSQFGGSGVSKSNLIDEIGCVVVDGNFNLFGKILFANKIISKLLGYVNTDVQGKLIHSLMPSAVAEVHNLFWNAFANVGIPKVLDQLRHLYVKDSSGYVHPFKLFIKFQFSPKFGYSFVGLFRKPQSIQFDEYETVKVRKSYQMVCNDKGKIIEISPSIYALMKISPKILDSLHNSLPENLQLHYFNQHLNIQRMDFSRHSCQYYKKLDLDFSELKKISNSLEILDENDEQIVDPFASLRSTFTCTMKVIKETYGSSSSTIINLYYVIFTHISDVKSTEVALDQAGGTRNFTSSGAAILDGGQKVEGVEGDSPIGKKRDEGGSDSDENTAIGSSLRNRAYLSHSRDESMNQMSVSSTASSSKVMSNQDIKYVEEGIDYNKTPKPLLYLKISTLFLFTSLIILASVQYGLNKNYEGENLKYQRVLLRTLQNQELISELTLMTRTYLNINLNLEPLNTNYFSDRKTLLQEKAEIFIEQVRVNIQYLHDFFLMQDINSSNVDSELSNRIVNIHSVFSNNVLQSKLYSRLSAINIWLVNVYQIFGLSNFTSSIGVFTQANATYDVNITAVDQAAFFVLANGQGELYQSFEALNDLAESLIVKQVEYSIEMNKYYVSVTSLLVVLLTAGSVYLIAIVLRFKSRVLAFFAEIDMPIINFNEECAREFYNYIVTDDKRILDDVRKNIEAYNLLRLQNQEQADQSTQFFQRRNASNDNTEGGLDCTDLGENIPIGKHLKGKPMEAHNEKKGPAKQKGRDSDCLSESKEDESEKQERGKKRQSRASKPFGLNEKGKKREQIRDKAKSKTLEQDKPQIEQQFFRRESVNLGVKGNGSGAEYIKNKQIAVSLHAITAKRITSMIILGILAAMLFIAYFVAQYFLFSTNELGIESNSSQMRNLLESLECTNVFLMEVRNMQTSNSSWYDVSPEQNNKRLRFVPETTVSLRMNQTYQSCIKKTQLVNQWLSIYKEGGYQLSGGTGNSKQATICSVLEEDAASKDSQAGAPYLKRFSLDTCSTIYQGVFQNSIIQTTSVFLQDFLYTAIRFLSVSPAQRTADWIKAQLAESGPIDLIDAHTHFLQASLRRYYERIIDQMLSSQDNPVPSTLFIVFMIVMLASFFIIICFVISRIKASFWHSFFILRLIPTEDVDKDFIKRINDYLSQA